jgi:uncharacterized membrane protein YvbJ
MKKICDNCHAKVSEDTIKCPMCGREAFTPENFDQLPSEEQERINQSKNENTPGIIFAMSLFPGMIIVVGVVGLFRGALGYEDTNPFKITQSLIVIAFGFYLLATALKTRKRE